MTRIPLLHSVRASILSLLLVFSLAPSPSCASEVSNSEDIFDFLPTQAITPSRAPKPLSQIAENITVITAKDIEEINAHTLADILDTVPGVQQQHNGGPGITTYTNIQSADFIYSQVFVDGVSLSNLQSNFADVSLIPAQIIERVEIVKGAASAAWGSALGGVINVITKSPDKLRRIGGSATASIGERTTTDTRAELSGSTENVGYYVSGGYLGSNGLLPSMQIDSNHVYTKLTYDLPKNGQAWGTFSYSRGDMGDLFAKRYDTRETNDKRFILASLGMRYTLTTGLDFEVIGRHSYMGNNIRLFNISDGALSNPDFPVLITKEKVTGLNAKLIWRKDTNLLVIGSEYNNLETSANTSDGNTVSPFSRTVDRFGIYLNDTYSIGSLTVIPGVRLDHTQTSGNQISYSLGATWQINSDNLLRAYSGRGFGLPILAKDDFPSSKIWTSQISAESIAIRYLWLKGTLFRNMTWGSNVEQHLAMGSELEVRTTPVFNTSVGASYTYTETTRTSDGTPVYNLPTQTLQVSLRYTDKNFRGVLNGRHIYWNSEPDWNGKYGGLLWDLHLGATLFKRENSSLEVFFSGHNLFNTSQYNRDLFPTVGRWFEGGLRVGF